VHMKRLMVHIRSRFLMATGLVAAVAVSGQSSGAAQAHSRPATSAAVHLYVVVSQGGIGRFPIVNGIVTSKPASVLNATPPGASAIADGSDGSLYVERVVPFKKRKSQTVISVYAPGAQGNDEPVRQFALSGFTYGTIAVDQQGYVYSEQLQGGNCCVEVYPPGANGKNVQPVNSMIDFGYFFSVDAAGNLLVSSDNWGVDVWATPSSKPTQVRQICLYDQGAGVAESASGDTFVAVAPRLRRHASAGHRRRRADVQQMSQL
jgi:hypothetical protein